MLLSETVSHPFPPQAPNIEDGKTVVHLITTKMLLMTNVFKRKRKKNLNLKTLRFKSWENFKTALEFLLLPYFPLNRIVFFLSVEGED